MSRQQQYVNDMAIEKMTAKFLDENFYAVLSGAAEVRRYSDKYHQFGGVDLSINKTNFDEKAKVKGAFNSKVNCIAFECTIKNKSDCIQNGWFLDNRLSTDYYALISLSGTAEDDKHLSSDSQISAADILWVRRSDVVHLVEEETTQQQLKQDADELREQDFMPFQKQRKRYPQHGKFWLTFSSWLPEKPVNLVVPRETLEQLPHTHQFVVTRNSFRKVR